MTLGIESYFGRLTAMPEIGQRGLNRLQAADLAVVGTGGVGSASACYLASIGVGKLRLIDQDIVEETNLHRLSGIGQEDLHAPKAEALARSINSRYPWTKATPTIETLRTDNCSSLLGGVDLIVDGTDNFPTRYVLNRFSAKYKVPYLFTSAIANQGHLSLFTGPSTPCLECVMPGQEADPAQSCETLGVSPTTVGVIGGLAAAEAGKHLLGMPSKIHGHLLTVDFGGPDFVFTKTLKKETCGTCGNSSREDGPTDSVVMLCGGGVANVLPEKDLRVDIQSLRSKIASADVMASSESVLVYTRRGHRISVFKTGRVLVSDVPDVAAARELAEEVWSEMLK